MSHILIIEDNPRDYQTLQMMMEFAMHHADVVSDSQRALEMLRNGLMPDAIVANLIMPGLDGYRFCRTLKQDAQLARLPVILLTQLELEASDEPLAKRAGASALLRKPLQREQFLAELDRAIMIAPLQENPLLHQTPQEESIFLRDYNQWLSKQLYQASSELQLTRGALGLRDAHVSAINTVTTALGSNLDLMDTASTLVQKTAELTRAQAAAIYDHHNENIFSLLNITGFGFPTPQIAPEHVLDDHSPLLPIIELESSLLFNRPDEIVALQQALALNMRPASAIVSPLIAHRRLTGFLVALRMDDGDAYDEEDADILYSLAGAAGLALRSAQLFSNLQQTYAELQDLDRRKSEFVAITSHELRTPIAIMLGYSSLLHEIEEDTGKKTQLAAIEKQAHFLSGMVDVLLNLHELQRDTHPMSLRCTTIQVDKLLAEALQVTKRHSTAKHEVQLTIDCDPLQIEGDEVRLLLAFSNLLDNAIKFSHPGGEVKVVVAPDPAGGIIATFEDHGIGIGQEHFERIFEPFYQVEAALTRRFGGMGLGLAIVKGIVELHGGGIEVKSRVSEGSRFIVMLPPAPPPERCLKY